MSLHGAAKASGLPRLEHGGENTPAMEIQDNPKRIVAWKNGESVILNQNQLQSKDALVNVLADKVKQYGKTVESLGG